MAESPLDIVPVPNLLRKDAAPEQRLLQPRLNQARTKIIATVGPACETVEILTELVHHGVDIFRINAAHGTQADFSRVLEKIRQVREITGFPVGVLLDLAGPKIRLGALADGPMDVVQGEEFTFIRGNVTTDPHQLVGTYPKLIDEVQIGDRILLADGTISMQAIDKTKDTVKCKI